MPEPKGDRIRTLRVRRGEKRSALAERIGISYKHMYGIETGHNTTSIEVLHRLATALEVDVSEVLAEPAEDDAARPRAEDKHERAPSDAVGAA